MCGRSAARARRTLLGKWAASFGGGPRPASCPATRWGPVSGSGLVGAISRTRRRRRARAPRCAWRQRAHGICLRGTDGGFAGGARGDVAAARCCRPSTISIISARIAPCVAPIGARCRAATSRSSWRRKTPGTCTAEGGGPPYRPGIQQEAGEKDQHEIARCDRRQDAAAEGRESGEQRPERRHSRMPAARTWPRLFSSRIARHAALPRPME